MILQAARDLGLSLTESIMVGDKPSDIEAARAAGVGRAYRVDSDNPESGPDAGAADGHYADLLSCATDLFPAKERRS
jgi:D-glycero-D-manno-heptose 1,7-bisphosphate phosphatase